MKKQTHGSRVSGSALIEMILRSQMVVAKAGSTHKTKVLYAPGT